MSGPRKATCVCQLCRGYVREGTRRHRCGECRRLVCAGCMATASRCRECEKNHADRIGDAL